MLPRLHLAHHELEGVGIIVYHRIVHSIDTRAMQQVQQVPVHADDSTHRYVASDMLPAVVSWAGTVLMCVTSAATYIVRDITSMPLRHQLALLPVYLARSGPAKMHGMHVVCHPMCAMSAAYG